MDENRWMKTDGWKQMDEKIGKNKERVPGDRERGGYAKYIEIKWEEGWYKKYNRYITSIIKKKRRRQRKGKGKDNYKESKERKRLKANLIKNTNLEGLYKEQD